MLRRRLLGRRIDLGATFTGRVFPATRQDKRGGCRDHGCDSGKQRAGGRNHRHRINPTGGRIPVAGSCSSRSLPASSSSVSLARRGGERGPDSTSGPLLDRSLADRRRGDQLSGAVRWSRGHPVRVGHRRGGVQPRHLLHGPVRRYLPRPSRPMCGSRRPRVRARRRPGPDHRLTPGPPAVEKCGAGVLNEMTRARSKKIYRYGRRSRRSRDVGSASGRGNAYAAVAHRRWSLGCCARSGARPRVARVEDAREMRS